MRSRLSLKNLVKRALRKLVVLSCLICGCTYSTSPTYLKENIPGAIQDICKSEYRFDVKATLAGSTLWIYFAVEDLLEKTDKPKKYSEKFEIGANKSGVKNGSLTIEYSIKPIPDKEKSDDYKYNKKVQEQQNNIWKALRRVLFSMETTKRSEPKFFCLVTADIKNGFEIKQIFYYLDLKKFSYGFISSEEYLHRIAEELDISPLIIGDKEGLHLEYRDFSLEEFVVMQIEQRIKFKFQKPEVDKNADIDKEVMKVAQYTLKTYGFKDFSEIELYNLLTKNRIIFNKAAVLAGSSEKKL